MCCAAYIARKPIKLYMVWVLLAHEWVRDFMCASPGYLNELQDFLCDVWEAVCGPGSLEHKLLTAACLLRAWKDTRVPDCRDALAANMVVLCLPSTCGLVGAAVILQVHVHKSQTCPSINCCQQPCPQYVVLSTQDTTWLAQSRSFLSIGNMGFSG